MSERECCGTCNGTGLLRNSRKGQWEPEIIWCRDCIEKCYCPKCGGGVVLMTYDSDLQLTIPVNRDDEPDDDLPVEEVCESCGFVWDEEAQAIPLDDIPQEGEIER